MQPSITVLPAANSGGYNPGGFNIAPANTHLPAGNSAAYVAPRVPNVMTVAPAHSVAPAVLVQPQPHYYNRNFSTFFSHSFFPAANPFPSQHIYLPSQMGGKSASCCQLICLIASAFFYGLGFSQIIPIGVGLFLGTVTLLSACCCK